MGHFDETVRVFAKNRVDAIREANADFSNQHGTDDDIRESKVIAVGKKVPPRKMMITKIVRGTQHMEMQDDLTAPEKDWLTEFTVEIHYHS